MNKSPALPPCSLDELLTAVRACRVCRGHLAHEPRPVLLAGAAARILVIGQAPGSRVHATGIPWNDPSGRRLRQWMGIADEAFYDPGKVAIIPMSFCYPGKGPGGDLPPRPECAPLWHGALLERLPAIRTTLLIGHYAQRYYLPSLRGTVAGRVAQWRQYSPSRFLMPHPSPRNQRWLKDHPWFEADVVPALRAAVQDALSSD